MEHKKAKNGRLQETFDVTDIQEREMNATIAHLIWVVASTTTEEVKAQIGILKAQIGIPEASMADHKAQAFASAAETVTRL